MASLDSRLVAFHDNLLSAPHTRPEHLLRLAEKWESLEAELRFAREAGHLLGSTAQIGWIVACNVQTYIQALNKLEAQNREELDLLAGDCERLLLGLGDDVSKDIERDRKRLAARSPHDALADLTTPPEWPLSPAPSTPPPPSPPLLELQPADHLRLWFLDHLANPYPTITEKKELSLVTGIAKNKIDSDMTNWRRRAGWTDIKDTYADRDKMKMKRLIEAVESGKEKRKVVIEAVEKMRAYLERREEYGVGSWVWSLKKMAKEEQARKRPRIEGKGKGKADRPITPPPSAHVTPASSASSVASSSGTVLGVNNTSPAISLRSTTSASSLGSTSSVPTFTNFKPYSFTPAALTYTTASQSAPASTTPAPPAASLAPGTKRVNADAVVDAPDTRQKLAPSPFSAEGVPQWASANPFPVLSQPEHVPYAPAYVSSASHHPAPPASHLTEPILWCATGPMPPHLPHMSTMPRTMPAFSIPQQHDFEFTTP